MAAGERTIRIKFDGSTIGLSKAVLKTRADLEALEKQIDANRSEMSKAVRAASQLRGKLAEMEAQVAANKERLRAFSAGVLSAAGGLGSLAFSLSNLSTGLAVVVSLTSALIAMSGAAGLIPAAMAGGIATLIAFKLGADGIKAAFAQLNPQLDTLKSKVSASFQSSLVPAVNNLKVLLPQVTSGFQQIATASGGVLTKITAWAKTPAAVAQLNTILSSTARIIQNVGAAFAPLIAAFVRVAAVAMPILVQLTSGFGAAADRFNAWVQRMADTGQITQWIQTAVSMFRQLFGIVGDIGSIVVAVFGALQDSGVGLGGVLGPVISQVKEFVQSAQGHDIIVGLARAIGQVGDAVSRVLGAALKAVGPAIPPLADAFGKLATQAANFLVPAIEKLAPLVQGLAKFLADNMSWLGPVAFAIGGVAAAIQGVTLAVNLWKIAVQAYTVVQWLLNAAMEANPIGIVILAITALIGVIVLIVSNLDFFRGIWDAVWKWASDVITGVVDWFRNAWNSVWSWFTGLLSTVGGFFAGVWNGARSVVGGVIDWFRGAWDGAVSAVRGFFSGLANFAGGIWDGIVGGVKSAINSVLRVVNGAIRGVNSVTGIVGIPAIPQIPYLAKGGTAHAGRAYLVGERGPELFTPGVTGRVTNAQTTAEAIGGGAQTIALTLDLGESIQQAFEIKMNRSNRATVRALQAGVGAAR